MTLDGSFPICLSVVIEEHKESRHSERGKETERRRGGNSDDDNDDGGDSDKRLRKGDGDGKRQRKRERIRKRGRRRGRLVSSQLQMNQLHYHDLSSQPVLSLVVHIYL